MILDVAFLGICDKALHINEGHPINWRYNLLGLRSVFLSRVYPINLKGLNFMFAVYNPSNLAKTKIQFLDENNNET